MNHIEDLYKACSIAEKSALSLMKSHISSYTRQDGTVVQEHEDSRQAKHSESDDDHEARFHKEFSDKMQWDEKHRALKKRKEAMSADHAKRRSMDSKQKYNDALDALNKYRDQEKAKFRGEFMRKLKGGKRP